MNIALFGTIFMDIKGFSAQKYDPVGRNVGDIKFIHGGVGRNIAENLGVLGVPVTFGSTIDDSAIGCEIINRLQAQQINTAYLKKVPSGGMGMWMAILNENGDLAGSISQMPDLALFAALIEEKGEEIIAQCSHVALEIDLDERIARRVIEIAVRLRKPVYGIPGNLEVARRHKALLAQMDCFICNDIEAEKIAGSSFVVEDIEEIKGHLADFATSLQMKSMIVTMGARGAVYYERDKAVQYAPVQPVKMVDSTGAGDSFFSGVLAALVRGESLKQAVALGAKVAAFTIQSAESTCVGFRSNQ